MRDLKWTRRALGVAPALGALVVAIGGLTAQTKGQEGATPPHWIWFPTGQPVGSTPAETRYFRKAFVVREPSRMVLDATADNAFTLYLDGKKIAEGSDWRQAEHVDLAIGNGAHVLAAVARNEAPGPAAFLLRGGVLPLGQSVPIHTNASWKTAANVPPGDAWTRAEFDEAGWVRARDLGLLGTEPWTAVAFAGATDRFRVAEGFRIEQVATPSVTGSIIAFTFDPQGKPCLSVERGPIVRLVDADGDGTFESKVAITPRMSNCQGLSFIKGRLYAVGDGPQGAGLYRLTDGDGDGTFETTDPVRISVGPMGEHGPHAVALGPDGRLYFNNGNHAHLKPPIDPASPVNVAYEGEQLPHYNDARGHAAGIVAPGGEIYRSDDEGQSWSRISAGYRNQYDFAFNRAGEVFTFDSDMEWDVGLPWYRPVRVCHATLGSEFGWRNGSGKWPAYYVDSLPSVLDLGRGSPTGVTFYQGEAFPEAYRDNFLICDWSQGRILAVALTPSGSTYAARATELVSGQPLNCTDIEVGPDQSVYFTTGGRNTQGGLYRVSYPGATAVGARTRVNLGPIGEAIAISPPLSSFAQEQIRKQKEAAGDAWGRELEALARDQARPVFERIRALDLLMQQGPEPSEALLVALTRDPMPPVRARALTLLGFHRTNGARSALAAALADLDPFARRHACESLMQQPAATIPVDRLIPLISDPDRLIRSTARTAIEHGEPGRYKAALIGIAGFRGRLEGMLALVRGSKIDAATQDELLAQELAMLGLVGTQAGSIDPAGPVDLLRLIGLTYLLGPRKLDASATPAFRATLLALFPTASVGPFQRELARMLAYLDEPAAIGPILDAQASGVDRATQIHFTYCLRNIKTGWTSNEKARLWAWYQGASVWDGGYSFLGYLDFMAQELVNRLSEPERVAFLEQAARYPFPSRVLARTINLDNQPDLIDYLTALYAKLALEPSAGPNLELRALIIEMLGRSRNPEAHASLRQFVLLDVARRDLIARALAARPVPDDLPILVAALETRDPNTAGSILSALKAIDRAPEGPEGLRNLIRLARRTGPSMNADLSHLGRKWVQGLSGADEVNFGQNLRFWESVYARSYPSAAPLSDESGGQNAYTMESLSANLLRGPNRPTGDPARGLTVLKRARCLDCHKFGNEGAGVGPDLTTVSSRFRPQEILESLLEPSKVVSDQYRSQSVALTSGQVYTGMPVGSDEKNLVLLLPEGTKLTIPKADIEEQKPSNVSVMPAGLLNSLTVQEIADMLALFQSAPRVEGTSPPPK